MACYTGRTALGEVIIVRASHVDPSRSILVLERRRLGAGVCRFVVTRTEDIFLNGDTRRYVEVFEHVWTANDMV